MKELSLNILDIAENSAKAGASLTEILIDETEKTLVLTIKDDGCGMSAEVLASVTDPFYTTRTTRKVGMGIPLLKMAAEQTGGSLSIVSEVGRGTTVTASFNKTHIDYTPLGDVVSTLTTLIQGHPEKDISFRHVTAGGEVSLDTRELRTVLDGVSLAEFDVLRWIEGYLGEQYDNIEK